MDSATPEGRAMMRLIRHLAEFHSDVRRARAKATTRIARGAKPGKKGWLRGPAPLTTTRRCEPCSRRPSAPTARLWWPAWSSCSPPAAAGSEIIAELGAALPEGRPQ
jgi:hypothetical protein